MTHLHVHTEYSVLDSLGNINKYIKKAKEFGMKSLAITDHGNLYGAYKFWKACKAEGIKPILGCEVYICNDRLDKAKREYYHLTLLAKNETGWKNLIQLSSLGFLEGFYYKPRIDHALLTKYGEGLICLSGCVVGEIPQLIEKWHSAGGVAGDELDSKLLFYKNLFGQDYYVEVMPLNFPEQIKVNAHLDTLNIAKVVTCDCHMVDKGDEEYHKIFLMVQRNQTIDDKDKGFTSGWLMSEEDIIEQAQIMEQSMLVKSIIITDEIADKIELINFEKKLHIPDAKIV